jgi:tetratricopeptide (TPR) repeat protein
MENNVTYDMEKLEKYLSGELSASETGAISDRLKVDSAMREEIDLLKNLQETIRKEAIRQKVKFLQTQFLKQDPDEEEKAVTIKPTMQWALRIAASFLIVAIGYGVYQFSATNADALYQSNFVPYQLPIVRGTEETSSLLDSLYNAQQYEALVKKAAEATTHPPHDNFLVAMSFIQTGDFAKAQATLEALVKSNAESGDRFFEQEAEYYLALAYIQTNHIDNAISLFEKIKQDKKHLYHYNVSTTDLWKLKILKAKS